MKRCNWVTDEPIYRDYHDHEWGVPLHDDVRLFEMLLLEGAQAGLSWLTILKRRKSYRIAYDGFDPAKIAGWDSAKVALLMQDQRIIRNRLKIRSAIANARAFLEIIEEYGRFDSFIWRFVDGQPLQNCWSETDRVPAVSDFSREMSRVLKSRGFTFVGPTICYAFMQAVGMVNDHTASCFRYDQIRDFSRTI